MTQCIKKSVIEPSMGYSRQNQRQGYMKFSGVLKKKWHVQFQKEVEFPGVVRKKCQISRGLGFWAWSSWRGVKQRTFQQSQFCQEIPDAVSVSKLNQFVPVFRFLTKKFFISDKFSSAL